jgi:hypothetical protein
MQIRHMQPSASSRRSAGPEGAPLPPAIERWHTIASIRDTRGLDSLRADDVVFTSSIVRKPGRRSCGAW